MSKKMEVNGRTVYIAWEELALFFNNATIIYGMDQLKTGMSRTEAKEALCAGGFDPVMATAFLAKMKENVTLDWISGKLYLPGSKHVDNA